MGDFEDIFGAGADIEAIIDDIDRTNNEEKEEEDCYSYSSGQSIPRALSHYELTGSFGSLPPDVFETLDRRKCELFAKEAQMLAEALPGFYVGDVEERGWDELAREFSRLFSSVTDRCCETLTELEAFLIMATSSLHEDIEAVLVRDTSVYNGMLGPGLSTHAIVLGEGFFLARFGNFELRGPFWYGDGEKSSDESCSYCSLATGLPGQEVLAVSKGASYATYPDLENSYPDSETAIRRKYRGEAEAWVRAHRQCDSGEGLFDCIANRASWSEGRTVRSWSDKQEQNLRGLIQQLAAAILPVQARYEILLGVLETAARIGVTCQDERVSESRYKAFEAALHTLIDLSSFRGRNGPWLNDELSITLFDGESDAKSTEDQLAGREVLLDLAEQKRLDRAGVQAAIVREDWKQLAALLYQGYIAPDFFDESRRHRLGKPFARIVKSHRSTSGLRVAKRLEKEGYSLPPWLYPDPPEGA